MSPMFLANFKPGVLLNGLPCEWTTHTCDIDFGKSGMCIVVFFFCDEKARGFSVRFLFG